MMLRPEDRRPDFTQLAKVLEGKKPDRPVIFEFFLCNGLIRKISGIDFSDTDYDAWDAASIKAQDAAGYDYMVIPGTDPFFATQTPGGEAKTISYNDTCAISDWDSFHAYPWPDPASMDYSRLDRFARLLPEGMEFIAWSATGAIYETVVELMGFDNLCYALFEEEELVEAVFRRVSKCYIDYYERCCDHPRVKAIIVSDDWGYSAGTMLSPDVLRKYVFPAYRQIVARAHEKGRYAILHSCGNFSAIVDDIVEMGFDARHSYEDKILPVEQAYETLMNRGISVLGGIDIDFITRRSPEEVYARAAQLLRLSGDRGGYALGTGNSVADYIPHENYFAMIRAAMEFRD